MNLFSENKDIFLIPRHMPIHVMYTCAAALKLFLNLIDDYNFDLSCASAY